MMNLKRYSMYLMSIGVGVLVGVIYGLLHVRSPAPPAIALLGLLGMLIGEQLVPIASRIIEQEPITLSWFCEINIHLVRMDNSLLTLPT
jgi:XapX domain-containing protein